MPKFESAPNINNPKLNPAEAQADVNVGKQLKSELTPEELEKLKTEKNKDKNRKNSSCHWKNSLKI